MSIIKAIRRHLTKAKTKDQKEVIPEWMRKPLVLPPWARVSDHRSAKVSICIDVDTEGYVNDWMALLAPPQIDQYWLEVAYQCAKLDVQMALVGTEYDPRFSGKPAEFHFSKSPELALVLHPHGRGVEAATKGKEARAHYVRIRGRMPF